MLKKKLILAAAGMGTISLVSLLTLITTAASQPAAKPVKDGREQCYQCHDEVRALKEASKHSAISCDTCHNELAKHVEGQGGVKPVTCRAQGKVSPLMPKVTCPHERGKDRVEPEAVAEVSGDGVGGGWKNYFE